MTSLTYVRRGATLDPLGSRSLRGIYVKQFEEVDRARGCGSGNFLLGSHRRSPEPRPEHAAARAEFPGGSANGGTPARGSRQQRSAASPQASPPQRATQPPALATSTYQPKLDDSYESAFVSNSASLPPLPPATLFAARGSSRSCRAVPASWPSSRP
jgi:hypothetical protein